MELGPTKKKQDGQTMKKLDKKRQRRDVKRGLQEEDWKDKDEGRLGCEKRQNLARYINNIVKS